MFSGTNLLTSCHSASCMFLLFLVSEKLVKKYSRNWTGQTSKSITFRGEQEVQRGAGEASQWGQTHPRRGWALPRAWEGCGALAAASASHFAYKKPPTQKP